MTNIQPLLRQREIALFFFPLVLNVQLMSLSHTIINGALARLDNYVTALAGFSVAMVVHLFIASPSYQNHTVTIAMVRGHRSLRSVLLFVALVAGYVALMLSLIAFTPVGDLVLERVLGAPPEVAEAAREALYILVLLPFFTGLRGFCQGLVIRARRTSLVSVATGIRVVGLLIFLSIGSYWFVGAQLGAFALVGCVVTETLFMFFFAWRVHPPLDNDIPEKGRVEILRYAFPLAYSSCLQQTIPLLICAIVGRLADGPFALAGFGVIRGFLFLLAGPMRNLQQAYLTLVRQEGDYPQLVRFAYWTSLVMGLIVLLIAGPGNRLVLGQWLGVATDLRQYLSWPLAACALFPALYSASNLLRGWFAGAHLTSRLGHSTLVKALFLLLCWGPIAWLNPSLPGVVIAIALLMAAESVEAGYLLLQRNRQPEKDRTLVPL
ncbi:MAG: hypothetical protein C0616_14400 [Desulfuromonas sp.]|nr:MAG: hypothetical protein C0616_14400 [Desulfuromonas sp.]